MIPARPDCHHRETKHYSRSPGRFLACLSLGFIALSGLPKVLQASSGTEGASFLDIPVGAGPAALGSAYTALAHDAYAPTWNSAGLGFLDSTQIAGQHLSYLQGISYEYASFAIPLKKALAPSSRAPDLGTRPRALGASVQYLGSGDIAGADLNGNPAGSYSSYFAAYNMAYGQRLFTDRLSLGVTGKLIQAKIGDVSAHSYAADLGGMYQASHQLTLGATLNNLGSKLTFLSEGDSLPLAFHLGAAYRVSSQWNLALEGVYPKTGLISAHMGVEWQPVSLLAFRAGYRTDTLDGLSALAGLSTGLGLKVWGQEVAYAWLPYADLGETHYFSALIRFGGTPAYRRNLIAYGHSNRTSHQNSVNFQSGDTNDPEYQQLMELMTRQDQAVATSPDTNKQPQAGNHE